MHASGFIPKNTKLDKPPFTRRAFIVSSTLAVAGMVLGGNRKVAAAAVRANVPTKQVTLVQFSDAGKPLGTVHVAKVIKSDAEWRRQLSPSAFAVARKAGTEVPFTGKYNKLKAKGVYRCICCDTALFDAASKFESGTGWPSFWQPIAKHNIVESSDRKLGMVRTEISCARCDAHLGHVFDDGPKPTGLRYCMNSVALRFAKAI